MNFTAWQFLFVFLPAVIFSFYLIKNETTRKLLLILASLLFYAISGYQNLLILLLSIAINYSAGTYLATQINASKTNRLIILWASIIINVGCLLIFKIIALYQGEGEGFRTAADILIPLALSYITFQQIGFVVSCYKQSIKNVKPLNYLFFIAFFPQLVMGPIVRFEDINNQLNTGRLKNFSTYNLAIGVSIFLFGLAKKVLLADQIFIPIDRLFIAAEAGTIATIDIWYAIIAFQLQLFLDFSAYADMAIGLAKIFGIDLPVNFDRPHFARNRFDLWRRWHISFAIFMRTHVFLPLVRHMKIPAAVALIITGILSGIWHGLGWTFILWGLLQTFLMLITHYRKRIFKQRSSQTKLAIFIAIFTTFIINSLIGVSFRTPTIEGTWNIYNQLFVWTDLASQVGVKAWIMISLCAFAAWIWPDTNRFFHKYWSAIDLRPKGNRPKGYAKVSWVAFRFSPFWAVSFSIALVFCIIFLGNSSRFIYVQF